MGSSEQVSHYGVVSISYLELCNLRVIKRI